jgi:hypothetical protein
VSYDPRDDEYNVTPIVRECEHEAVDNQGVCENCGDEIPDWEPSDAQIFAQHGQTMEPRAA